MTPRSPRKPSRRRRVLLALLGLTTVLSLATMVWQRRTLLGFVTDRAGDSIALPRPLMQARLDALSNAITEMDVMRAQQLALEHQEIPLSVEQSQRLAIERARLGLYVGDCDSAEAILATLPPEEDQVKGLASVAHNCAGAVAASRVVQDVERGIWLRLQDNDDEPLVPFIVDVADHARRAVEADLGVDLPRPLRIDVVRDLFSLSSVSGLPLEAAETTGTVAVARWGRITLLSPRASRHGYPWEDTMAHEIVHLALSRATRDFAPLWLQEGVAKRQEQRWRAARPFDDADGHDRVARHALDTGTSVGVDNLGPSIAMLPSADAASIAFSEVTSFINFWIEQNGRAAFRLLLADLKGLESRDPDPALIAVSGYSLGEWILRWQVHLLDLDVPTPEAAVQGGSAAPDVRAIRLGDLLMRGQHFTAAARRFEEARALAPSVAALRYRASQARLGAGDPKLAASLLGQSKELDGPHAGWFALRGRFDRETGNTEAGTQASRMALSLDPWSEIVACEGYVENLLGSDPWEVPQPTDPAKQLLCTTARARPPVQ